MHNLATTLSSRCNLSFGVGHLSVIARDRHRRAETQRGSGRSLEPDPKGAPKPRLIIVPGVAKTFKLSRRRRHQVSKGDLDKLYRVPLCQEFDMLF